MLTIASINSGSNGNCYYIGNNQEAVLVDAGISAREIVNRMKTGGLDPSKLRGIFVSHEHSDHIKGVEVLSKKLDLPVFSNHLTYRSGKFPIQTQNLRMISHGDQIKIGELTVTAFSKNHDATDPLSFTVEQSETVVGIFTDIGEPCENVIHHFGRCTAAFLEANYDEQLLASGPYPFYLKNRIAGSKGHLSNSQALDLFLKNRSDELTHLILSHLSKDNNHPDIVANLFNKNAGKTRIEVASRYGFSAHYNISKGFFQEEETPGNSFKSDTEQLTLF